MTVAAAVLLAISCASCAKRCEVRIGTQSLKADGADAQTVYVAGGVRDFGRAELKLEKGVGLVDIVRTGRRGFIIQSRLKTGKALLAAKLGSARCSCGITIEPDYTDADSDGFPDVAELNTEEDRHSFREWFEAIADSQYEKPSTAWLDEQRDCAGLVRFAYREALKAHTTRNLRKFGASGEMAGGDVRKFNYPGVPILGESIFRIKAGPFERGDEKKSFSAFADAKALREFNTARVSKDINDALPGDLLFFLQFGSSPMPDHTMIVMRGEKGGPFLLLYHTGPTHGTRGRIKRISVNDLIEWQDERWHPVESNPYFMGVYRFKIIN